MTEASPAPAAPKKAKAPPPSPPTAAQRAEQVQASKDFRVEELAKASEPADIAAVGPEAMSASGAFIETDVKHAVDVDHPAVDNNPRAGTTVNQNRIDFNDPNLHDDEAVAANLNK